MGISILWSLLSCFRVDRIGWINSFAAVMQTTSILFIVSSLLYFPKQLNSSESVYFKYQNESGFSNVFYVACIGNLFSLYSFSGFEASAHMAEGIYRMILK